jgi:cysteine desulfurase/selenocysteine lyase
MNVKEDFPILNKEIHGYSVVYLDNAATSQKPVQVLNSVLNFYKSYNANVHRGIHTLSEEATAAYEEARSGVAKFIGAAHPEEIIFTKGATESLNTAAFSWALPRLSPGDVILLSELEHHSNLVPWQIVAQKSGAVLKFVPVEDTDNFTKYIDEKVRVVAVTHASNFLGTILPIKEISKEAHKVGAKVIVDGAQAVPHLPIDVQSLDCDFYAFSGHKMLGPTGIGVLYAKKELLVQMEPVEYGGGMIDVVQWDSSTFIDPPERFEAGTPNVGGAIGLHKAIKYSQNLGMENIRKHGVELTEYALAKLGEIEGLNILGPLNAEKRTALVSFDVEGVHSHDVASVLDSMGIAVRSGHHCCMPLHKKLGLAASTRASFYIYNSKEDVDRLVDGVKRAISILR